MKKYILCLWVLFAGVLYAQEYTVDNVPNPQTTDANNFVSNPDGILDQQTVSQINGTLQSLRAETTAEVAVVALNSIGHADIKDFAIKLFEKWGIGRAQVDNGLLILFVLDQRAITFETGYGLEGALPDAISKRIQMQAMIPEFRNGDYNAGILAGVERVASVIREEPVPELQEKTIPWGEVIPLALGGYILLALLAILWVNSSARKIRKDAQFKTNIDRYLAMKNRKTGVNGVFVVFIPIVLALFVVFFVNPVYLLLILPVPLTAIPANIYGKIQMRKMRRAPIPCDVCGGTMHLLSEKEEDEYLQLPQQFEEKLKSVDYDVFLCDNCKNETVFPLDKPSAYTQCPRCGTKAFAKKGKHTIVAPTYLSTGVERTDYKCEYCGYEEHKNTKLPRLQRSVGPIIAGGAAGGSFSSGRGGFGGGGGSFGGGRSGGGGATSGW